MGGGGLCYCVAFIPTAHVATGQEPCERRGGRPGLPVLNGPHGPCGRKATLKKRSIWASSGQDG